MLPGVFWAYRTTSRKLARILSLAFTYGMEAIIPIDIGVPTLRTEIPKKDNDEAITKDLDMVDELREAVAMSIASYQQRLTNLHNKHVKPRAFRTRDLVLRRFFENMADPAARKFQPNWEGPYIIVKVGATRSYALNKLNGTSVPRMWNAMYLKRYYQ